MIKYLSPTSLALFERDRREFYLRYVVGVAKMPQTKPMAVGSAFDAYVKATLVKKLFGTATIKGVDYSLDALLAAQVDPQNLDWARAAGLDVMSLYTNTGALADLVLELEAAIEAPRFEFTISGTISGTVGAVPFLGRPDLSFKTAYEPVILDWKVNGWMSASPPSPCPGYLKCRTLGKSSKAHKDTIASAVQGFVINIGARLEDVNTDWAAQEAIYAWLLGTPVGTPFIAGIEQIVGRNRVSTLRMRVGREFQLGLFERAVVAWKIIQSGDICPGQAMLDEHIKSYNTDESEHKDWLEGIIRGQSS